MRQLWWGLIQAAAHVLGYIQTNERKTHNFINIEVSKCTIMYIPNKKYLIMDRVISHEGRCFELDVLGDRSMGQCLRSKICKQCKPGEQKLMKELNRTSL